MDEEFPANPDYTQIAWKLKAPKRQSGYEKLKAEAEAKRTREEAETAAVFKDFLRSFGDTGIDSETSYHATDSHLPTAASVSSSTSSIPVASSSRCRSRKIGLTPPSFRPVISEASKRHFTLGSRKNLPSVDIDRRDRNFLPRAPTDPSLFGRKRTVDGSLIRRAHEYGHKPSLNPVSVLSALQNTDNDTNFDPNDPDSAPNDDKLAKLTGHGDSSPTEPNVAKVILKLSNLPPCLSLSGVKELLQGRINFHSVCFEPSMTPGRTNTYSNFSMSRTNYAERRSNTAYAIINPETSSSEIDSVISAIQGTYLGLGYTLSISRHLSTGLAMANAPLNSVVANLPFGARPMNNSRSRISGRGSIHKKGFGSVFHYDKFTANRPQSNYTSLVHVSVPEDIREIIMIHKTVEAVTKYGAEFEALLMARPKIQNDPRWAWLWDARSASGVYYRWRLWCLAWGMEHRVRKGQTYAIFDNGSAWVAPESSNKYEYVTAIEEFVSDGDYDSSNDEFSDDGGTGGGGGGGSSSNIYGPHSRSYRYDDPGPEVRVTYLNPLNKAKLTFMLTRLPSSIATLRKVDIARITAFAISHVQSGAEEIVRCILLNVEKPFNQCAAKRMYTENWGEEATAKTMSMTTHTKWEGETTGGGEATLRNSNVSSSQLVGLYVVSDILAASSACGVTGAWRYRNLFETGLRAHATFEKLGRLDKEYQWGRLKAQKWRRSIDELLRLWETWSTFTTEGHEYMVTAFTGATRSSSHRTDLHTGAGIVGSESGDTECARARENVCQTFSRWKPVSMHACDDDIATDGNSDSEVSNPSPSCTSNREPGSPSKVSTRGTSPSHPVLDSVRLPDDPESGNSSPPPAKPHPRPPRPRAVDMFAASSDEDND